MKLLEKREKYCYHVQHTLVSNGDDAQEKIATERGRYGTICIKTNEISKRVQ